MVAPFTIVMFPIAVVVFFTLSLVWNRLHVMTWGGHQHEASTDTRLPAMGQFWQAIAKWPLGYGINQGADKAGTINGEGVFTLDSHYIATFLDYGVIGGFAYYAAFVIGGAKALYYGARGRGTDATILLSIGTMMAVFLISKAVLIQDDSHGAVFMALGLAAALSYREHASAKPKKWHYTRTSRSRAPSAA